MVLTLNDTILEIGRHSKGNKTVPEKMAKTRKEDRHK
jgi:hypothetical protein